MSDHQLQDIGIADCETVEVYWDISQVQPNILNDSNAKAEVMAVYNSPNTERTATWTLPWNTEGVLELRDATNRAYHAGTKEGIITFFSKETETGPEVILDERAQHEQVKEQLYCDFHFSIIYERNRPLYKS